MVLRVLPLSVFSVRLPTAIIGIADVVLMFLLAKRLFRREWLGLVAAGLLALTPAHFILPMFVTEGNRYNVRGDIAFAQSIVETAWFFYPDYGQVHANDNNFSGIGACDSCGTGFGSGFVLLSINRC